MQVMYPAYRMRTFDYMYTILPVPKHPSMALRFMFYAAGAPTSATHIVGKFPRYQIEESQYSYDEPYETRYTDQGADVYWSTARGTYNLLRYWGVQLDQYGQEEGLEAEMESVVDEVAGYGTTYLSPDDGHYDPVQEDAQYDVGDENVDEEPVMAGGRSDGGGSQAEG